MSYDDVRLEIVSDLLWYRDGYGVLLFALRATLVHPVLEQLVVLIFRAGILHMD